MLIRSASIFAAILCVTTACLSIAAIIAAAQSPAVQRERDVPRARFTHLKRGINLSDRFAQSAGNNYSKDRLDTHTTAEDIALIKAMGFDRVRWPLEPAPLMNPNDPGSSRCGDRESFGTANSDGKALSP